MKPTLERKVTAKSASQSLERLGQFNGTERPHYRRPESSQPAESSSSLDFEDGKDPDEILSVDDENGEP